MCVAVSTVGSTKVPDRLPRDGPKEALLAVVVIPIPKAPVNVRAEDPTFLMAAGPIETAG